MLTWLAAAALAATPVAGLSWTPLSRADLVWVDDSRNTGLTVGEFDGVVRPGLEPFGGVWWDHAGVFASLGVARATATSGVEDAWLQQHRGVVRPALDVRWRFAEPTDQRAAAWVGLGAHGNLPSARFTSNGFTPEEQAAADEQVTVDRARLGGVGGRAGIGADLALRDGLWVGGSAHLRYHRGTLLAGDVQSVAGWLGTEAALTVTFAWPEVEAAE